MLNIGSHRVMWLIKPDIGYRLRVEGPAPKVDQQGDDEQVYDLREGSAHAGRAPKPPG